MALVGLCDSAEKKAKCAATFTSVGLKADGKVAKKKAWFSFDDYDTSFQVEFDSTSMGNAEAETLEKA